MTETNWLENFARDKENASIENIWNTLKSQLLHLRDNFVPKKCSSGKPHWTSLDTVPISKEVRDAIKEKRLLHRRWMSSKKHGDAKSAYLSYAKYRNKVKRLIHQSKRKFEKKIAKNCKHEPKLFWAHVRTEGS